MTEIKDKIEYALFTADRCNIIKTPQEHRNLLGGKEKYIKAILAIKELAVVDRDAKLPSSRNQKGEDMSALEYKKKLTDYVKEIK